MSSAEVWINREVLHSSAYEVGLCTGVLPKVVKAYIISSLSPGPWAPFFLQQRKQWSLTDRICSCVHQHKGQGEAQKSYMLTNVGWGLFFSTQTFKQEVVNEWGKRGMRRFPVLSCQTLNTQDSLDCFLGEYLSLWYKRILVEMRLKHISCCIMSSHSTVGYWMWGPEL